MLVDRNGCSLLDSAGGERWIRGSGRYLKDDEKLTVGEWMSKPVRSWSKNVLRRVTFESILGPYWGLSVGRWIKWWWGRNVRETGKVGCIG